MRSVIITACFTCISSDFEPSSLTLFTIPAALLTFTSSRPRQAPRASSALPSLWEKEWGRNARGRRNRYRGLRRQTATVQQRGTTKVSIAYNSWVCFRRGAQFDGSGTWYRLFHCAARQQLTWHLICRCTCPAWTNCHTWAFQPINGIRPLSLLVQSCRMCVFLPLQISNPNIWHWTARESTKKRKKVIRHSLML